MAESHRDEIAKLEALYANNPEGRVFTHLAEAYRKAGELDRARRIVEQGLERHPDYSSAHVVLGRVLMDQGEDTASVRAFERVLELDRHNLVALKSLGDVLHRVGRPGEALERYRDLLIVDPGDDRVRMTVARLEQEVLDSDADVGEAAEAAEADHASGAQAASGPMESEGPSPEPAVAGSAVPAEARSEAAAGDIGGPADEAATEPEREQPQQQAVESAPDAGSEPTPAASEADAPSEAPQSDEQQRGRDPWEERFAPPQPALPGDLAVLAAEGGAPAPESTDRESVEFYDFRASSLTEFGWARERGAQREPAPDAAASKPSGEQPEVAPSEVESAYGGDDAEPDEQVAADESSTDVAIDAGGDGTETTAGSSSTEAVAGGANEAGEWLSPEAWARLSKSPEHAAASGPPGQGASDDDDAEDEVLTETMAELYEAQGFHHRAAEIYQALLRRQPGDERLLARLRQAESDARQRRAATSSEERTPNVPASEQAYFEAQQSETEPGEQEHDDAWAEDVESVWTGGAGVAGAVPTPYAWTDQESGEEVGPRRPIREFFNELLRWRPSGRVAVAAEPAHETAAEAVDVEADVEAELTLTEDAIVEATAEGGGAVPSDAGDQSGWFERAGEGGPTSGEEDEDLEMFRSWLQSLKK